MADFFGTLTAPFNPSIGANAANQAAGAQTAAITAGMGDLSSLYGQGQQALQTNYMAGLQPALSNVNTFNQGATGLSNALGLNGPAGTNAAYQSYLGAIAPSIQLGTQNVQRGAAAAGGGQQSGATLAALQQLAQQTGMQGWQNYISGLQPYLGGLQNTANTVLGGYSGLGQGLNQNLTGLGQGLASGQAAIGSAQANADLAAAQAQQAAGGNIWNAIIGGAGALSKFMPSDIRVKDDVERIGTLTDGLPLYRFRYKGSPRTEVGLMAQDVEQVNPEAVTEVRGIKLVNYDKATSFAAGLDRYLHG
jgi:hypothetical protein